MKSLYQPRRQGQTPMRITALKSLLLTGILLFALSANADTWYVKPAGNDANAGNSWANAFQTLQKALASATSGDAIWVAAGTYYPDEGPGVTDNDRNTSFNMKPGVAIYGGFPAAGDPVFGDRDWDTHVTILSGDLMQNDGANFANNGDNALHVVIATSAAITATAILDGFTVTAGNANDPVFGAQSWGGGLLVLFSAAPTISNCTVIKNAARTRGGGMSVVYSSAPTITNCAFIENVSIAGGGVHMEVGTAPVYSKCSFIGNLANADGGGCVIRVGSIPAFTNCLFSGNKAIARGGAVYTLDLGTKPNFTNCSFSGNKGEVDGGAIYNPNDTVRLTNCLLWGNSTEITGLGTTRVNYSIVQGGYAGIGNLDQAPLFVSQPDHTMAPTTAGDLHLIFCSPAINAGTNAGAPADDLDGNTRPQGATVDMGAYEATTSDLLAFDVVANSFCDGGTGGTVQLSGSQPGVDYQLKEWGGSNIGAPLPGTGDPLDFGLYPVPVGNYTVIATSGICDGVSADMNGPAAVTTVPCNLQVPNFCNCGAPDGRAVVTLQVQGLEGQNWTVKAVIGLYDAASPPAPAPPTPLAVGTPLNYTGGNMFTLDVLRLIDKGYWVQLTNGNTDLDIQVGNPSW
ncbi:MAG: right-handed parallel beta-helix repeat-containing protein [Bacteroidetes bacterium]|nr:MAG: right-handed parallel beta-helix repeat-containing protein [Bacteroidota bacterium]